MDETGHLMSEPENRDWLMESKAQLEAGQVVEIREIEAVETD